MKVYNRRIFICMSSDCLLMKSYITSNSFSLKSFYVKKKKKEQKIEFLRVYVYFKNFEKTLKNNVHIFYFILDPSLIRIFALFWNYLINIQI